MKKILLGITLGLLLLLGACSDDTSTQEELTAVLGTNTLLSAETEELHSINKKFLEANEELGEDHKELNEEYEELTEKLANLDNYEQKTNELRQEHKENTEAFEKEITELEGENKEHSDKFAAAEQKEREIAAANKKEASKQQTENKSGTNTTSKSNTTSASDKTSTPKTASKTTEAKQDCNIKGSSSGIYHTPGSTYYDKTTNPAAMFCSVEEAQNAGYRAPKR